MNRKLAALIGVTAVVVTAAVLSLVAQCRLHETQTYSHAHAVRTYGGTNYIIALEQTTIGRTDTGYILILAVRLQNPNPFPVRLDRNWFVLVDHDKDYYQPTTEGTQTRWIDLPSRATAAKETLSYTLPADALAGTLGVQLGQNYWTMVKDVGGAGEPGRSGEFRSFQRRQW